MSTTAAAPASRIFVFKSTAERMETPPDFVRDSNRRRARGEPPRDAVREPYRRHCGPWYSFRPFDDDPDAAPYAVVSSPYRVGPAEGAYGETLARVGTGTGAVDLAPEDVVEAALAGRFGLKVVAGPLLDEAEAAAAAAESARESARLAREAGRESAREAAAVALAPFGELRRAAEAITAPLAAVAPGTAPGAPADPFAPTDTPAVDPEA